MPRPIMFMLAGPNGAGKSTLYETVLKPKLAPDVPFINADVIQRDELKDPSMGASYKAAEIAEQRRREHLAAGRPFVSESTFSHESKLALVREAKEAGFSVAMYHVNVRDADLSVMRVANRVDRGGHPVPEDKIRERYARNPALIREAVAQADRAYVYDNSRLGQVPELALHFKRGKVIYASDRVPTWARDLYAKELEGFAPSRLNPAAASFADAKTIAERVGGPDAITRVGGFGQERTTRGEVVGESGEHWVQRASDKKFVAHFKRSVAGSVRLHHSYEISYPQKGRAVAIELVSPHGAAAKAFREQPPEAALKTNPQLAGSYAALEVIRQQLAADGVENMTKQIEQGKPASGQDREQRTERVPNRTNSRGPER